MTPPLQFIPFRSRTDRGWADAWSIYEQSFPDCERWDEAKYDDAFEDPRFEAAGVWLEERLAGIVFSWKGPGFRYLEHLAVPPAMRGRNLGSQVLRTFCERVGHVILEIDPPEDDISIRRLHFYERAGFAANPYTYIHPSFRRPFQPHRLVLMSYPAAIDAAEARAFADFVRTVVLRYSEHERPELPSIKVHE